MAKILISFLGTSRPEIREYAPAKYRFDDGAIHETTFIAKALAEHYRVDKIILIGTAKSMWEEVYRVFAQERQAKVDDIYFKIAEACDKANHTTPPQVPCQADIEGALGNGSKVVLIKYGLNQEEIEYNSSQVLSIEDMLDKGDEVTVDITHSFRSLPMILMNTLIYLQNVSQKHIKIERITYGMFEVTRELGYTPVVDLSYLLKMNDWISGAYAFSQFGHAEKIASLMEDEDKDVAKRLSKFSDILSLNHIASIKGMTQELQGIKSKSYRTKMPGMVVNPTVGDFVKRFSTARSQSAFQYRLAQWQYEHHNYCSAYLTLQEAIVTYYCEQEGLDPDNYKHREQAKEKLNNKKATDPLTRIYRSVKKTRNGLAHSLENDQNYKHMVNNLRDNLAKLNNIIQ